MYKHNRCILRIKLRELPHYNPRPANKLWQNKLERRQKKESLSKM